METIRRPNPFDADFLKGGQGSGNFGHQGRPGEQGGSAGGKGQGMVGMGGMKENRFKGISYYGDISDPARLRRELLADGVVILKETTQTFIDGTSLPQFTVQLPDGVRGYLVPTSEAARERQRAVGRYLMPYGWVNLR